MSRLYPDYTYGDGPRAGCWWDETCDIPKFPSLMEERRCDVAIIGGGFTGVSAALHLAEAGVDVALLEAKSVGWGASGRNGGFCCLGGAKLGDDSLDHRFGKEGRIGFRHAERAAVGLVDDLTRKHGIDVDRHSDGEIELAHRPKDMKSFERALDRLVENYGAQGELVAAEDLPKRGLGGLFHGGLINPIGFGLNPRKYIGGLVNAATRAGAAVYEQSAVVSLDRTQKTWRVGTAHGAVLADQVIFATNGYSSETLPTWLSGRYVPTQSAIVVTRPLTPAEQEAARWTSDLMAYDTRNLVHYFRLMPDGRFLFGMRGGLLSGPRAQTTARARVRRDFEKMFPAWAHVETPFFWSGLVCIAKDYLPYVGPVPDQSGLWVGMCYHGNGVAMGSLSGRVLSELAQGTEPDVYPMAIQQPLSRFGMGRLRRLLLPPAYAGFMIADL